jgi:integrase/recombinase XerD
MKQAKVLTQKELKKVLDYIDAFDRHAERNRAMLLLTHLCGCRVSEVASLKLSDVVNDKDEVNDIIFLSAEQTKGSDSRRVFVNTKAKSAIKRYLQSNISVYNSVYLFTTQKSKRFDANTLQQLLKRLYARCSIVGATSHSGRRSFITKLATSGVSVRVIAELASHKSIQTTQRYIEINDDLCSNAVELI